jgi:tetratricopeptide (TPR) repeat protein
MSRPVSVRPLALGLFAAASLGAPPASAQTSEMGVVAFETSCDAAAQPAFDEAITLLHHMMYVQAEAAFGRAAAADPDCAMAQWGIGMANFHPLWAGQPSEEGAARGQAAMQRAAALAPGSDREAAWLDAVQAFYGAAGDGYGAQLAAWAEAQEALLARFPDDVDAGAFAALARLATAPRDPEFAVHWEVGAMLEDLNARAPEHPGVFHYAIHAYDQGPLAEKGLPFARGYSAMAPEVPHALHMQSHIFTRLGFWGESAEFNIRSARAALTGDADDATSAHYAHAIDYAVYALLQQGDVEGAAAQVAEMLGRARHQQHFGAAYALSAAPARVAMEQGDWAAAAALSETPHDSIDWTLFPQTRANIWLARGVGAARTGDAAAAREAEAALAALHADLVERGGGYWAELAEAQRGSVAAWATFVEGDTESAVTQMRAAAEIEDRIGKSAVTPGHVVPARELLGDMLMELGREAEAREAYEATLALSPDRRRSSLALSGLNEG